MITKEILPGRTRFFGSLSRSAYGWRSVASGIEFE